MRAHPPSHQASAPTLRPARVPPQRPPAAWAAPRSRRWALVIYIRGLPRPLLVGGGCLAVTALGTPVLRWLWPEVALEVAALVSAVLFAGLVLWWPNRGEVGAKTNLGTALLAGTLAAVAVFAVQADLESQRLTVSERQARERAAATERQTLKLSLGLQQDLTGMDLEGQNLAGFYLRGKNFSNAELSHANLADADLSGANLSGTGLIGANLRVADLGDANLTYAFLIGANLSGALLINADLRGALFDGANLRGADLGGARLAGAQFTGADLTGADLSIAYLSGADLKGAFTTGGTQWPEGFDWRAAGVTRG